RSCGERRVARAADRFVLSEERTSQPRAIAFERPMTTRGPRKLIAARGVRGSENMRHLDGKNGGIAFLALFAAACGSGVSSLGGHDGMDAAPGGSGTTGGNGGSMPVNVTDGASDSASRPSSSREPTVFASAIATNDILVDDNGVY